MASSTENNMAVKEDERRNWIELPREVTASILSRLTAEEILTRAQFVCKSWLEVSNDPLAWKRIDMYNIGDHDPEFDYDKMCRNAVDRSAGQAVDVNIEYFGNDDILEYISDRSSKIERLRLTCCYHVSDEALIKTVKKLPLLEDLELTLCSFDPEAIEALGQNCPSLKSFKLNSTASKMEDLLFESDEEDLLFESDEEDAEDNFNQEAFAIGKNMPGLKNLMLIGNSMTNNGLKAILCGCPGLESLDMRKCLNINMSGKVWVMCTKQVKLLRLPGDSTKDYPFQTGPDHKDCAFGSGFKSDSDDVDDDDDFPWNINYDGLGNFNEFDDYDDEYGFSGGDYPFDYDDFTVPDNYW